MNICLIISWAFFGSAIYNRKVFNVCFFICNEMMTIGVGVCQLFHSTKCWNISRVSPT